MDDATKQKYADERYREIRSTVPIQKYEGNYKSKHYIDVPNQAIKQTVIIPTRGYMTEYEAKFIEASKDFWRDVDPDKITKYMSGEMVCSFNTDSLTIQAYFSRIFHMIKESVTMELSQSGQTSEELKSAFEMLGLSLKVLADQIVKTKKDINVSAMICFMHGFVNMYVKNNIKGK